jgi:hypothetical protein
MFSPPRQDRLGTYPDSYPMGTGGSLSGVKRPGRETDHSPPPTAKVKNAWSHTSTPPPPPPPLDHFVLRTDSPHNTVTLSRCVHTSYGVRADLWSVTCRTPSAVTEITQKERQSFCVVRQTDEGLHTCLKQHHTTEFLSDILLRLAMNRFRSDLWYWNNCIEFPFPNIDTPSGQNTNVP